MTDKEIETGTTRSLLVIGRDVCRAAREARNTNQRTFLTVNGDHIAAIVPTRLAAKAQTDKETLDRIAEILRTPGQNTTGDPGDLEGGMLGMLDSITDLVGMSGRATEPYEPGEDPADECYGADGQPLPYGRCDTCGAPCSAGGCTADAVHETALEGEG